MAMANPSQDQRGTSAPPPPRRSRTRRDPSADEVYRVPPQDFAHTVQRLTGAASPPSRSRSSLAALGLAADEAPQRGSAGLPPPPALSISTPGSMQEAYLAWCASNNVVLSPGTMAEMERGAQS
ncbi:hypothetical protein BAE44_0026042 [Dichanthelium oligosanthes]|uniref:VQ domain-containing protein n=1 Tax=Dichanthelium oligosanthes TaxID=888268 RepID=A0A1E5UJ92_9POAL|nr:hypothetical protein BAE44_0026042 [Dichanthelium oligosanthes]